MLKQKKFNLLFLYSGCLLRTAPILSATLSRSCYVDVHLGVAIQTYVGEENER